MEVLPPRRLKTAAELLVASQFALFGFDILQQPAHARFDYDLGVADARGMIKLCIAATSDEFWDLLSACMDVRSYHPRPHSHAIDKWLELNTGKAICLVHFDSTEVAGGTRVYIASAETVAASLRSLSHAGDHSRYPMLHMPPGAWLLSRSRVTAIFEKKEDAAL